MIVIGDPTHTCSDGNRCEVRFLSNNEITTVVHNNLIEKLEMRSCATSVSTLDLVLSGPKGTGLARLHHEAIVEIWSQEGGGDLMRVGVARLEYFRSASDQGKEHVEIQGRSPCANLLDIAAEVEYTGTLRGLLQAIASDQVQLSAGIPETGVSAYIAAPSAYVCSQVSGFVDEFGGPRCNRLLHGLHRG